MLITSKAITRRMIMAVLISSAALVSFGSPSDSSARITAGALTEFSCKGTQQQDVQLQWKTVNATGDIVLVEVQRSADGLDFSTIGKVKCPGNVPDYTYSFVDNRPRRTTNYYRLKLKTKEGNTSYSKMMIVELHKSGTLGMVSATPDPVTNDVLVSLQLNDLAFVNMTVTDSSNKTILQYKVKESAGLHTYALEHSGKLSKGTYFLQVVVNGGASLLVRLEKN